MDETKTRPGNPGDRAQAAAEKLRALRERANHALDEHRQRLSQIETELSNRVRQLADEFDSSASPIGAGGADEVAALREQLQEDRAKHEKFVEQLAAARRQLDAIQSQPCASCQDAAQQLADAQAETNRLREQLAVAEQQQEEDRARQDKFTEQVAAARQAIADLQSKSHEQTSGLQAELDAARAAKAAADEQVAGLARDLELLHTECDALQTKADQLEQDRTASLDQQRHAADAEIKSLQERLGSLEADLAASRSASGDATSRLQQLEAELAASQSARNEAESRAKALEAELASAQQGQDARSSEIATVRKHHAELEAKLAELTQTHAAEQKSQAERLAAAEAKQSDLERQLSAIDSEKTGLAATLTEMESERRKLEDALAAAQEQIDGLTRASADAASFKSSLEKVQAEAASHQRAGAELQASLDHAKAELAKVQAETCPRTELTELQQKFELALGDLQKFKRENGELREQLASGTNQSEQATAEIVGLRTERDELAHRVKELEQTATTAGEAASSQELEDLQRRFQMAVDDVRQLKQENAQLREQLAAAKTSHTTGSSAPAGGSDWASQKARLLAMLESEEGDGAIDAERRKERASIQDTIERTDRVIAEIERELQELRDAQDVHTEGPSCNLDREREQMLAADELVAAERDRLAKLQTEWEEKLRAAELEFSVERAKLAREQAAIKERMFELQKLEAQGAGLAAEGGDNKPRRRWLAALGLGDEGEEDNKKPNPK